MNEFDVIKDSSIWLNESSFSSVSKKDPFIRIGTVIRSEFNKQFNENRYLVEVFNDTDVSLVWCKLAVKFGGITNYEEYSLDTYSPNKDTPAAQDTRYGDRVYVMLQNGRYMSGIIVAFAKHPARKNTLKKEDGIAYKSCFNGVETAINKDGEYTLTFKGIPTNIAELKRQATSSIVAPEYDEEVGGTFVKFDKTGSWELNDKASSDPQSIKLDKKAGIFTIKIGEISLIMDKNKKSYSLKCEKIDIDSKTEIKIKTKEFSIEATGNAKMKAKKVAIGTDGTELLDQLGKLIDALGMITTISPVGNCAPLSATPQWGQVMSIKSKLESIKGDL